MIGTGTNPDRVTASTAATRAAMSSLSTNPT
ncbi:MAG: hypothetical protein JWM19_6659 [Actinomycetia bacterium]|nr:hypothetical protein [Actinomycetes bacterium]